MQWLTADGRLADLKSDNILLMYTVSSADEVEIERVNVADWDNAAKVTEGQAIFGAPVGNVMWRSPEAHVGIRIGKPSDIFSFGIIVRLAAELSPALKQDLFLTLIYRLSTHTSESIYSVMISCRKEWSRRRRCFTG